MRHFIELTCHSTKKPIVYSFGHSQAIFKTYKSTRLLRVIFFLLIIILNSFHVKAQLVVDYYENDSIRLKGDIRDGLRNGYWQSWYDNGNLKYEGNYNEGVFNGMWKFYCHHGFPEKEITWENGKCINIINYFFSGAPYLHINFDVGISAEEYLEYNNIIEWGKSNQRRYFESNNINDSLFHYRFMPFYLPNPEFSGQHIINYNRRNNVFIFYDDSVIYYEEMKNKYLIDFCLSQHQQFEVVEFQDSTKAIRTVKQFEDGKILELRTFYFTVEPFGLYKEEFYLNNDLINSTEYTYLYDTKQKCTNYYDKQQIESTGLYEKGLMQGKWKYFNKEGKLIRKEKYVDGLLMKQKIY